MDRAENNYMDCLMGDMGCSVVELKATTGESWGFLLHTLFLKNEVETRGKNAEQCLFNCNGVHVPNFSYF